MHGQDSGGYSFAGDKVAAYQCDNKCGFTGTYTEVAAHERTCTSSSPKIDPAAKVALLPLLPAAAAPQRTVTPPRSIALRAALGLMGHDADRRPAWRQVIPSPAAKKLESLASRLVSKKIAHDSAPDVSKLAQLPMRSWSAEGPASGEVPRSPNCSGRKTPQPPLRLEGAEAPSAVELQGDLPQRSKSTPRTTRAAFDGARDQLHKVLAREPSWSSPLPVLATCVTCGTTCSHCAEVRAETLSGARSPPPSPPSRPQGHAEGTAVDPAAGPSCGAWRGGAGRPARSSSSYHREAIRAKLAMRSSTAVIVALRTTVERQRHELAEYGAGAEAAAARGWPRPRRAAAPAHPRALRRPLRPHRAPRARAAVFRRSSAARQ